MFRLVTAALTLLALTVPGPAPAAGPPAVQEGDIIFQTSRSTQSLAVQRATGSPWSHMGIVLLHQGRLQVFEAAGTVRYAPLDLWIARGEGGRFVVKRLRDAATLLTPAATGRLRAAARTLDGRPYDLTFEWSDARIYCSELVWKLYDRTLGIQIGATQRLRDFALDDPAVRAKMRERYGDKVPLDETVISPDAMYRSPLLVTVAER